MPLTTTEIWEKIVANRIASRSQCQSWMAQAKQSLHSTAETDSTKLLKFLIARRHLSLYQARVLAGTIRGPLRRGQWLVLAPVDQPLWSKFFVVQSFALDNGESSAKRWACWLAWPNEAEFFRSDSARKRFRELAGIQSAHLQSTEMPDKVDGLWQLTVSPLRGKLLTEALGDNPPKVALTLQIIKQLAQALSALHTHQFVHGRVMPDRIYWDSDRGLTLALDLSKLWQPWLRTDLSGLMPKEETGIPTASFLAPEVVLDQPSATQASDIYSLGACWWWLLTGVAPIWETTQPQILPDVTRQPLPLDRDLPELPPSYRLCLQQCLAQNHSARFQTADELLDALAAADRSVAAGCPPAHDSTVPSVEQRFQSEQKSAQINLSKNIGAASTSSILARRRSQRRKQSAWLWTTGGILLTVTVGMLLYGLGFFTGNRDGSGQDSLPMVSQQSTPVPQANDTAVQTPKDRIAQHYQLVESLERPWVPPLPPAPLELNLLPPGVQGLIWLRPAELSQSKLWSGIIDLSGSQLQLGQFREWIEKLTGQPWTKIESLLIAFYPASQLFQPSSGQAFTDQTTTNQAMTNQAMTNQTMTDQTTTNQLSPSESPAESPSVVYRVTLTQPQSLQQLRSTWPTAAPSATPDLSGLVPVNQTTACFAQATTDESNVKQFSIGPIALMREVAELSGGEVPINIALKQLHARSSQEYPLIVLGSARFLLSNEQKLLSRLPTRLSDLSQQLLGIESRGLLLQTHVAENWYWEVQVLGNTELEAPRLITHWREISGRAASDVEAWLVQQAPHPFWRALSMRFPQMLRSWFQYARFSVEDGVAIANGYLPPQAAENLLIATWIAGQDWAVRQASSMADVQPPTVQKPLTIEQFLNSPIQISFIQEPIERALALIAEEANAGLPNDSQIALELDGAAFEKAGITRNQQLREFRIDNRPVREALTEIAKRGNPIATVTDTRQPEQWLIWAFGDNKQSGARKIWLTTRDAAQSAGWIVPEEFSSAP